MNGLVTVYDRYMKRETSGPYWRISMGDKVVGHDRYQPYIFITYETLIKLVRIV